MRHHTLGQEPAIELEGATTVLEREETAEDGGDGDRYAHYVRKDKIVSSATTGRPVVALCGKVWRPNRDPNKYPVCPACKEIYESMIRAKK